MKKLILTVLCLNLLYSVSAFEQDPQSLFNEAESRYLKGDYPLSLKLYEELIQGYPLSKYVPEAVFRTAVIHVYTGDYAEAEKGFSTIETRYSYSGFASFVPFWRGVVYYREKRYSEAVTVLTEFLSSGMKEYRKDAIVYKARSEYELSDIRGAAETLGLLKKESYRFDNDPSLFSFYVYILEQNGDYTDVISLINSVPFENWESVYRERVELSLAESYYKTGESDKAEKIYSSIITAQPDIASVGLIRLFTLYKNNIEKQKEILSKAQVVLAGYPDLIDNFYVHIGIESYKQGDYDIAGSYLGRVWKRLKPGSREYLVPLYLSLIKARKNDLSGAESILEDYLKDGGVRNEEILYTLSDFYLKDRKWASAEKLLSEIMTSYGDSGLYSSTAWLYSFSLYNQKKYSGSLAVIESVLSKGRGGSLTDTFLRLKSKVYMGMGRKKDALSVLSEYIPLHPGNVNAKLDYIILSFQLSRYGNLLKMYDLLKQDVKDNAPDKQSPVLLSSYIAGITLIGEKKIDEGISVLKAIDKKYLLENNLESIYPYVAYYIGWGYYLKSDYPETVRWMKIVFEKYPESVLVPNSLYIAGWASYLKGNYGSAAEFFAGYSRAAGEKNKGRGLYYYGKSMMAADNLDKAELIFQNIYKTMPEDRYADDALYMHARILEKLGKTGDAVLMYRKLFENYPRSTLAEEGLYKTGELYFEAGEYSKARKAFYTYRSRYPGGKLVDASLYWGGVCAIKMGEKYGALLLWEKLVNSYPDSSFRSEVLRKVAAIYSEEGEYSKALEYYSEYVISYPKDSDVSRINAEIEKLKLLSSGLGEREASLLVTIKRKTLNSPEGRSAAIELAGLYLYNDKSKWDDAYNLLTKVAAMKDWDKVSAAKAQFYIGEYYAKKYQYKKAAEAFIEAVKINPGDKDLSAISIYRAAENSVLAKDRATAEKMINLLNLKFPSSQWSLDNRKLLKGGSND